MDQDFIRNQLAKFNVTDAALAELKEKYLPLKVEDVEDMDGYLACKEAHQKVKKLRTSIDPKRKELVEDSLKFSRAVNAEAKRIVEAISEVEDHLLAQRKVVEDEQKRKQEEVARKKKEEEDRLKREEEERLVEQKKEQAEKEKKLREDQEKLDEEKRAFEAKKKADQEEQERIEREKRQAEEVEKAKQEAVRQEKIRKEKEEEERIEKAKQAELEAKKQEEMAPDNEKLQKLANDIRNIAIPEFETNIAFSIADVAECSLLKVAKKIEAGIPKY